jgi:hypothetical protein
MRKSNYVKRIRMEQEVIEDIQQWRCFEDTDDTGCFVKGTPNKSTNICIGTMALIF